MSCPIKYRAIGDFHAYYSGAVKAPYLTIFVGGNHEASNHLWELYYGGWVAPNIYYMGAANVVRLGDLRIAGMSGIWKGYNYNKPHYERLPYNQDDIKSIYHVRELDVRKLLQIGTQIDIGISHDWPRAIEKHGDERHLFKMKPDFEQESKDGTLGNQAAAYVMDRLRPPYWLAAHMHCKFAATKVYEQTQPGSTDASPTATSPVDTADTATVVYAQMRETPSVTHNGDEIDLDLDDESPVPVPETLNRVSKSHESPQLQNNGTDHPVAPSDVRAQLPAAFSRAAPPARRTQPGQPVPSDISNRTVRFLALDKCLPGRKFLQLLEIQPLANESPIDTRAPSSSSPSRPKPVFEYDPEWLAITRVFASELALGDKTARPSQDAGEEHYQALIDTEMQWIKEHIVQQGKLGIPDNFEITAPPFQLGTPEIVGEGPREHNNPQTHTFCDLIGIENKFFLTVEQQEQRLTNGPAPADPRVNGSSRGREHGHGTRGGQRGGGRGRGRGHGRSRGRGRGRG